MTIARIAVRDMSPDRSADLTEIIVPRGASVVAYRSAESAEHFPDYEELGTFATRAEAERFLTARSL